MRCNEKGFRERRATLLGRAAPELFPLAAADWDQALAQLRRLRYRENWWRIGSSDTYWDKAFFVALIEMIDMLALSQPEQADELSRQCLRLAERIRVEACPSGTDTGKASLLAWAHAVRGTVCLALDRPKEAKAAFERASWLAGKAAIFPWAKAEVDRRHAALYLIQGNLEGLALLDAALENYGKDSLARAATLVLRAEFFDQLGRDASRASLDLGLALELLEPTKSPQAARLWTSALHYLLHIYAVGRVDLATLEVTFRRIRRIGKRLSKNDGHRRALTTWLEALLMAPLGATRGAKRLLNRSQAWLAKKGYPTATLCSLDLALLHLRDEELPLAHAALEGLWEAPLREEELTTFRHRLLRPRFSPNHLVQSGPQRRS